MSAISMVPYSHRIAACLAEEHMKMAPLFCGALAEARREEKLLKWL